MKKIKLNWLFVAAWILLFAATPAIAASYITDKLEITLRSGPSTEFRITDMLPSGTLVEVKEEREGWSKVTTSSGKEGWVISRYITQAPPARPLLAKALKDVEKLNEQKETLSAELKAAEREAATLSSDKKKTSSELSSLQKEFSKWKEVSAGVVKLQEDYDNLRESTEADRKELEELRMENRQLKARRTVYWGLSGALVLLVGYLLGHLYAGSRRQKAGGYRF
ncbi:MAG: TIGR04211 family SH3 domain-containing protein [Deltaproteobacteria bacterium]|nr:MAG: TIGR04211 family SH3 domain-containing protein [Deltaproteobacteria bacterium]